MPWRWGYKHVPTPYCDNPLRIPDPQQALDTFKNLHLRQWKTHELTAKIKKKNAETHRNVEEIEEIDNIKCISIDAVRSIKFVHSFESDIDQLKCLAKRALQEYNRQDLSQE